MPLSSQIVPAALVASLALPNVTKHELLYLDSPPAVKILRATEAAFDVSLGDKLRVHVYPPYFEASEMHRDFIDKNTPGSVILVYLDASGGGTIFEGGPVDAEPGKAVSFSFDTQHAAPKVGDRQRSYAQFVVNGNTKTFSRTSRSELIEADGDDPKKDCCIEGNVGNVINKFYTVSPGWGETNCPTGDTLSKAECTATWFPPQCSDEMLVVEYCNCNCPNPKTKSTLSTGAIIGITIGVLFIVSLIIFFIYRSQLLTTRFASRTGEQLIQ